MSISAIAIFDIGKTNKKMLVFDRKYTILHEENTRLTETTDDDGFACEDVAALTKWVRESYAKIITDTRFTIKAVNFSAYGASFVYLDEKGEVILPLYNYLKAYPKELQDKFYKKYGGISEVARQTASPVLGSLNSGMQVYRLKEEKPESFSKIKYALHLPQYLSHLLTGKAYSDITSIGCHTNLWDFKHQKYHEWVRKEGIEEKFPAILNCTEIAGNTDTNIKVGAGLHDSSAALIPYLDSFKTPFLLLSTGTWCISLNPFNHSQLSDYELNEDCLCYLSYEGKPVKASRLFAGDEHEKEVKRLAGHYQKPEHHYMNVEPDMAILRKLKVAGNELQKKQQSAMIGRSEFSKRNLNEFKSYEEAYHQLVADLVVQQVRSTNIVLKGTPVKKIYVDGGFGNNPIYMQLLAMSYPALDVYAAKLTQATAMGAALAIHRHWNSSPAPSGLIALKQYKSNTVVNSAV
jgi:sugar (pentulose or hexulose) kinase